MPGQSAIYSLITRQPGPQICQRMPYITGYPLLLEISSKTPTISNLSYLFDKLAKSYHLENGKYFRLLVCIDHGRSVYGVKYRSSSFNRLNL